MSARTMPTFHNVATEELRGIYARRAKRDRELAEIVAAVQAQQPPPPPTDAEQARMAARESTMDFIPWSQPKYHAPHHLKPVIDAFDRAAAGESVHMCFSAPPQFGKSDTINAGIARALWKNPALMFSYSTYADNLSRKKARKVRALAEQLGVNLSTKAISGWETPEGGGLISGGVRGGLTGNRIDVAVIDDAYKNRIEAESVATRQTVSDFLNDVAETRLTPDGSVFIFMTRWHPDDLIGECVKNGWEFVRLGAITDDGESLWPERWPIEKLLKKKARIHSYTWESLYMGRPRPRGAAVFEPPKTYTKLPTQYRAAGGLDLSYSAKTSSDHSVFVKAVQHNDITYIVDVVRKQVRAPAFKAIVHRSCNAAPKVRITRWYTSTTEQGSGDLFDGGDDAVHVRSIIAKGDKLTRSQRYAGRWNAGLVLVPENAPWLDEFVTEHLRFTGVNDGEDDQVDAAVAADDELATNDGVVGGFHKPAATGLRAIEL